MAFALVYTAEHYALDAADAADEPFTTFTYRRPVPPERATPFGSVAPRGRAALLLPGRPPYA
jgi:hypothetical protein